MAWSEKLPSGRYRGVYRDAAGKRRSAGTFTHKRRAENEASAKEAEARRRISGDPDGYKRPWGEWCDEWWLSRSVEASTLKVDEYRRSKHLDPRWSGTPIGSITRHDVKEWAAAMRRAKVGPASVRRAVALFSGSLSAAVDAEVIDVNPAQGVAKGLPSEAPADDRYLTRGEYDAIRAQLPTTGDQLIADVLVNTGMRWGEMAGLHWHRVDLSRAVIVVASSFNDASSTMKGYPKGKRSREVPLTGELVEALGTKRLDDGVGTTCGVAHDTGRCRSSLVFTTPNGAPLRNSNWGPVWRDAVARSGVGHARPYDLRHSFASWLLQEGVPMAEVGQLLGHVSTQTTERYARLARLPSAAVLAALSAPRLPHPGQAEMVS